MPEKVYRLTSPYTLAGRDDADRALTLKRVQCDMPSDIYYKFFEGTLAGIKGRQFYILTTLIDKLIKHCHANGIPTTYDPDTESRVAEFLEQCNFNDIAALKQRIATLESEQGTLPTSTKARVARGTTRKPNRSATP